ncbi:hypothetical protein [Streptomyces sp. NPDC017964]
MTDDSRRDLEGSIEPEEPGISRHVFDEARHAGGAPEITAMQARTVR